MKALKYFIKSFISASSTSEEVSDSADYSRVKKWVIKVCVLYAIFSTIAIIAISVVYTYPELFPFPMDFLSLLYPVFIFLTCWGYATLIIYLPQVVKSIAKFGKAGYKVGEQIETKHIRVTHEFGNNYTVSSYTENKGCLFSFITGFATFFVWAFFCIYIGPFLTVKKLFGSIKRLSKYKTKDV